MIITKEQQEAWVSNYVKEKHTQDECIGFIDGVEKALDVVNKNFDLALVSGRSEQLVCPFCKSDDLFEFELKHSKCRKCNERWTN